MLCGNYWGEKCQEEPKPGSVICEECKKTSCEICYSKCKSDFELKVCSLECLKIKRSFDFIDKLPEEAVVKLETKRSFNCFDKLTKAEEVFKLEFGDYVHFSCEICQNSMCSKIGYPITTNSDIFSLPKFIIKDIVCDKCILGLCLRNSNKESI